MTNGEKSWEQLWHELMGSPEAMDKIGNRSVHDLLERIANLEMALGLAVRRLDFFVSDDEQNREQFFDDLHATLDGAES